MSILKKLFKKEPESTSQTPLKEVKQPLGDGKAIFMDEGYHDEFEELKKEEAGLKPWYKRIGL